MRFQKKRYADKILVLAIWFLVIGGGTVYAVGPSLIADASLLPIPSLVNLDPNMMVKGLQNITGAVSSGTGAFINALAGKHAGDASIGQGAILEAHNNATYQATDTHTADQHTVTNAANQLYPMLTKAGETTEENFAAADNLINAMTVAVITEYSKSEKENVAEFMRELIEDGYMPPDALASNDPDKPYSPIAKALALAKASYMPANIGDGSGLPGSCKGLTDRYGASIPGDSSLPPAQRHTQSQIVGCTDNYLFATDATHPTGLGDKPSGPISANTALPSVIYTATQSQRGEKLHVCFKNTIMNCSTEAGSGVSTGKGGDNSDHAPFFIKPAYADSPFVTGGGMIASLVQQYNQKQQANCNALVAVQMGVGQCQNGGNTISPLQAGCSLWNSAATNLQHTANNAPMEHANEAWRDIREGLARSSFCQYFPHGRGL